MSLDGKKFSRRTEDLTPIVRRANNKVFGGFYFEKITYSLSLLTTIYRFCLVQIITSSSFNSRLRRCCLWPAVAHLSVAQQLQPAEQ